VDYFLKLEGYGLTISNDGFQSAILNDMDLYISPGEIVGLIGASGSGKSMTARAMLRLLHPFQSYEERGQLSVRVDEKEESLMTDIGHRQAAKHIGLVFQQSTRILNPTQKIGAQLGEKLIHNNLSNSDISARVLSLLDNLDLQPAQRFYESYPHQLSGGQMQRVLLALALINEPKLLIADEPFSALDTDTQAQILSLIKNLHKKYRMSILLISHDLSLVKSLCERLYFIDKGRIIESGSTAQIFKNPNSELVQRHVALASAKNQKSLSENGEAQVLFELQGINKTFASKAILSEREHHKHEVLTAFNMKICEGEILGLVGQSGSGKTTIGRMLLRLEAIDGGQVLYKGSDIHRFSKKEMKQFRQDCQIIFQDPLSSMSPHRTIKQHFQDAASVINEPYTREEVISNLEKVDLDETLLDRVPMQLSGGQRQRVIIARVLYMKASFIVCDEIFSSLDRLVADEIMNLIVRLVQNHSLTLLLISHDRALLEQVCHRIVSLEE